MLASVVDSAETLSFFFALPLSFLWMSDFEFSSWWFTSTFADVEATLTTFLALLLTIVAAPETMDALDISTSRQGRRERISGGKRKGARNRGIRYPIGLPFPFPKIFVPSLSLSIMVRPFITFCSNAHAKSPHFRSADKPAKDDNTSTLNPSKHKNVRHTSESRSSRMLSLRGLRKRCLRS